MSNTSIIFNSNEINGSITERFLRKFKSKSIIVNKHQASQNKYVDTCKLNQLNFLKKSMKKLNDFKNYEISPRSSNKTARSRICLKHEVKEQHKGFHKPLTIFEFKQSRKNIVHKDLTKTRGSKGGFDEKVPGKLSGLINLLRNSVRYSSQKSEENPNLSVYKRKLFSG